MEHNMNERDVRAGVIAAIQAVAPEVDAAKLAPARRLRDQVDLDSMDWLNVIVGLHERFGVEIPETDYARLGSLDSICSYLSEKLR
jgi:acyl carrier protein